MAPCVLGPLPSAYSQVLLSDGVWQAAPEPSVAHGVHSPRYTYCEGTGHCQRRGQFKLVVSVP